MSTQVLVACIASIPPTLAAISAVVVALIYNRRTDKKVDAVALDARAARKHSEAAQEQVTNSHNTNLRDDIDRIHAEVRMVRADVNELRASDLAATQEHSLLWRAIKAITTGKD